MNNRTYFFQPEKKLMNQGFFLQDEEQKLVYEAKCLKQSLFGPAVFEFTNHVSGNTEQHKVGKTVTTEQEDCRGVTRITKSYFKFDGENIWDYLKGKGVRVTPSSPAGLFSIVFTVSVNDQDAAVIEPAAPGGGPVKIPSGSHFHVTTAEEYLDFAFLAAFAIAKTDFVADR